jgi:hypothetical protein
MIQKKKQEIDTRRLAALVKTKRAGRTLRVVAGEAEVAPATIMRVENERPIDLERFLKVCRWLRVKPELLFHQNRIANESASQDLVFTSSLPTATPDQVEARLRQDAVMSEPEITSIASLIKAAYDRARHSSSSKNER